MSSYLPLLMLLLLVSAVFSASEAALFTLATRSADRKPAVVRALLSDSVGALTVILFGNLLVNLSYFALSTAWARGLGGSQIALLKTLAVLAIVLFGEILPKTLAHRYPDACGRVLLWPVLVLHRLFGKPAHAIGRLWVGRRRHDSPLASDQLQDLLEEHSELALERQEHGLLDHLLELGTLRAGALRRPLHRVEQVAADLPLNQALARLREGRHAWAAVRNESGQVVGILDLTRAPRGARVADAMVAVPILPDLAPVAAGIPLLQQSGAPFLLLVDEFGASSGILERGRWADTLLDRLPESHAGEVATMIRRVSKNGFLVDAHLPLHEFADHFGDPGPADGRTETLSGLVEEHLGRVAEVGDVVRIGAEPPLFEVRVLRCDGPRAVQMHVRTLVPPEESA